MNRGPTRQSEKFSSGGQEEESTPEGRPSSSVVDAAKHESQVLKPAISWRMLVTVASALVVWFLPVPEGVSAQAWQLLALFVATVVGIILKPLPMGAVAIIGVTSTVITGTLSIQESLSGFSNSVIWLIVVAFFISRGFIKSGFGNRVAYLFVSLLGSRTLGLGYGLVATDLVLAPAIPSNTARAGGVVFPVLLSVATTYGSEPEKGTSRKVGAFLSQVAFQGTLITSAMFLTAMAANPLAAELAEGMGVEIGWVDWAVAAVVPGIFSLVLVPLTVYWLYPPEIKQTPGAARLAQAELEKMGQMKVSEWVMLGTFVMLLTLWIMGRSIDVSAATTALVGLSVLLLSGVLTWSDICREREAWNTLVWFAALVMMATQLNDLGLIPWFSEAVSGSVAGVRWEVAFLVLSLVYFYSHYLFASNTAHVSSMYAPFLAVALVAGTPPLLAALVLAFFSNLFSSMTHYGTGPAPIFFGAGYVDLSTWWKLGALISVINICIWLVVGSFWWKLLGLW